MSFSLKKGLYVIRRLKRSRIGFPVFRYYGDDSNNTKLKQMDFKVDRSGLIGIPRDKQPNGVSNETKEKNVISRKEPLTPLARDLISHIQMRGPLTLHEFIAQASNNQYHGYYQHETEKIGERGDFVTSPEISQLFGEIICIWCVSVWTALGSPQSINLVEMGPGNGTLMADMLRAAVQFPDFKKALTVHMVELSPALQQRQAETLGCSLPDPTDPPSRSEDDVPPPVSSSFSVPVQWHRFLRTLPPAPALFIAQEFLDTFPVHQFRRQRETEGEREGEGEGGRDSVCVTPYTEGGKDKEESVEREKGVERERVESKSSNLSVGGSPILGVRKDVFDGDLSSWREVLVDVDGEESSDSSLHFRLVLSSSVTPAARILLGASKTLEDGPSDMFSGPMAATAAGLASSESRTSDGVEVSPLAMAAVGVIADKLVQHGGAALIIDYGESKAQIDTLRAFQKHKQTHPLSRPGEVDVTADVDFAAISRSGRTAGASVLGPVTQGEFLMQMGIVQRVERLLELESTSDTDAQHLVDAVHTLVGDSREKDCNSMGTRYKVLGMISPIDKSIDDKEKIVSLVPGFMTYSSLSSDK